MRRHLNRHVWIVRAGHTPPATSASSGADVVVVLTKREPVAGAIRNMLRGEHFNMGGMDTSGDDVAWRPHGEQDPGAVDDSSHRRSSAASRTGDESTRGDTDAISELRKILPDLSPALIQRIVLGQGGTPADAAGDQEAAPEPEVEDDFSFCPPQQRSCSEWWMHDGGPPWLRRGPDGPMTRTDEPGLPPLLRMLASALRTATE